MLLRLRLVLQDLLFIRQLNGFLFGDLSCQAGFELLPNDFTSSLPKVVIVEDFEKVFQSEHFDLLRSRAWLA